MSAMSVLVLSALTLSVCQPGWYCPKGEAMPCPLNTFSGPNSTSCTPCPIGTGTDKESSVVCDVCPPGTFSIASGQGCEICPSKYKCPFGGVMPPIQCVNGETSGHGATSCGTDLTPLWIIMGGLWCFFCLMCTAHQANREQIQRGPPPVQMEAHGPPGSARQTSSYAVLNVDED